MSVNTETFSKTFRAKESLKPRPKTAKSAFCGVPDGSVAERSFSGSEGLKFSKGKTMASNRQPNTGNHIAAIHVLKSKLGLSDADYRALIEGLTRKSSSKDMSQADRQQVRDHMQRLAERSGVATAARSAGAASADWRAKRAAATPSERKVWALWNALRRAGKIGTNSEQALNAWIKRTVHVDTLRFCTGAQIDTLIEALKVWNNRE